MVVCSVYSMLGFLFFVLKTNVNVYKEKHDRIIKGKQRKTNFEKVNEQKSRPVTYTIATTERCSRYVLDCSLLLSSVLCCFIVWELTFVKRKIILLILVK